MSLLQKGMSCAGSLKLPEDSLREMAAETGIVINLKKVYRLYRAEATDGSAVAGAQSHWAMDMIIQGSSIRGRLTAGQRRHCACPQTARVDIRRSAIAVGSSERGGAGTVLLERARAGDHPAKAESIRSIDGEDAVISDVAGDRWRIG